MGRRLHIPAAVVVVGAATLVNFVYSGVYYCAGLFFYDFMQTFQASRQATALALSLLGGSIYISGVVSGPLITQYGSRLMAIIGAGLASIGLIVSAFAPNLAVLYAMFGVLTGFNQGFLMASAAVCVQQHTSTRRALADGIALTGSALGGLVFPLIFSWGQSLYGWRGTLLLLSGLHFNTLPAAMLLIPPPPSPPPGTTEGSSRLKNTKGTESTLRDPLEQEDMLNGKVKVIDDAKLGIVQNGHPPGQRKVDKGLSYRVCCKLVAVKRALKGGGLPALACILMSMFRFVGVVSMYAFLPMKAESVGSLPGGTAAHLMSVLSTGELVGRVATSLIACLHTHLPVIFFVVAAFIYSVLQMVMGSANTLTAMVVTTAALGVTAGVETCCASTVVRDIVGLHHFPWVLGLSFTAAGIGHFTSVQVLALVWEKTDNISYIFLICGLSMAMAGLTVIANKVVQIMKSKVGTSGGFTSDVETSVTTLEIKSSSI